MSVFDEDQGNAAQALFIARASLKESVMERLALERELTRHEGIVSTLTAQLPDLQANLANAQSAVTAAQAKVDDQIRQLQEMAKQEPHPAAIPEANPAYALWQQQVTSLKQALDSAQSQAANLQPAVDAAQAAYARKADQEPPETLPNGKPNPAHRKWEKEMKDLKDALDRAQAEEAAARQAATNAQAAYDTAAQSPPPQMIDVPTPAHLTWVSQMTQLSVLLDQAKPELGAAVAGVSHAQSQIDSAHADIQSAQAQIGFLHGAIDSADAQIAARQEALAKAQAEVDKVARWIAVVAGTSTDPTAIVEVVIELTNRLSPAEDDYRDAAEEALRTDAALFWMTNRVAELQRRKAMIHADIENLKFRQKNAVDAHNQVEDYLEKSTPS